MSTTMGEPVGHLAAEHPSERGLAGAARLYLLPPDRGG
jgi:hypothetical protein